jgi:hypothetical protein
MAINSNFYVAQNNATLDIGYRDGSGTQLIKSWYWNVDGNLKLPSGGYILNSDDSIYGAGSSYSNVEVATYLQVGNIANISVAGNVTATYFVGNGALLTGIVGGGSNYGNANVTAYTVSMGFTNFSNVNVSALITTNGLTNYSNVNAKAYTETMGFQNFSNVNVAALITTNGLTNYSNVNVIAYLAGNITVGNIAGSVNGFSIGYRDVPQITVANLTLIASDAGKHYYGANTNPTTITIPTNANVAFGNGTAISIVNQGTGNITVANAAGVSLYLAGNSTAGSRTLTSYGMATLIKVQVNTWFINGSGVV